MRSRSRSVFIYLNLIIILIFIQNDHQDNCFNYGELMKGTVFGSKSPPRYPPQYVLTEIDNVTQFLHNTCVPLMKFNLIEEKIYDFLSSNLRRLSSILLRNLTQIGTIFAVVFTIWCGYKYLNNLVHTRIHEVKEQCMKVVEHKVNELKELCMKDIGRLNSCHEKLIRLEIENKFGFDFAQGAKFVSIQDAVQHVLERINGNSVNLEDQVKSVCSQIRDFLRPSNDANKAELVTGIQKELLLWYLKRIWEFKNCAKLERRLKNFPWVGEDGKLSLVNVRKCIYLVHKNLRQTLAFLAQTIDWDDLDSFISSRAKKSKGKAVGHGFYFLMHFFYSKFCDVTNATAHERLNFLSFPPSGEIELDAQGVIETVGNTVNIKIGEIKTSKGKIPEAKKQLKRSLIFFAGLHKLIADNDGVVAPMCYDLTGYIFISGVTNLIRTKEISLPPVGKISYMMYNS